MNKPIVTVEDAISFAQNYTGDKYHAILCDPPYNLDTISKRFGKESSAPAGYGIDGAFQRASRGFMGQSWDSDVAFKPETWRAFRDIVHPGGFGLAFGGARTFHRMASAIESAGFIIHPMIGWVYSSGMPHATKMRTDIKDWAGHRYGLGALKPALEPICIFQKPFSGPPVLDIIENGAGALNIDDARIPSDKPYLSNTWDDSSHPFGGGAGNQYTGRMDSARWPANFIDGGLYPYFFQPKPNPKERNAGLDGKNPHATIKPIDLNRYLATLLLPPLMYAPRRLFNPFAGAGSEAIGAHLAGWEVVDAIEIEPSYAETARKRIDHWCS